MKPLINSSIKDFYFTHKLQTRFRDIDGFNHVNNAVFLSYFEDARKIFFKRWNVNMSTRSLIVAAIKVDYYCQLKHPSNLVLGQKISRLGKKSFDIAAVLFCDNKLMSSSITTVVCYNFEISKSIPLFPEIKKDYNL
tara:strand:+ start:1665 stop:2075 length:411 start_codon:yes stop_codon:yes gene_type:complete